MTAPSNANTSGLENAGHIVWWKAGGVSYYPEGEAFGVSKSCRVEPLVTAASAQARIGELESRLEYLRSSRDGHAAQAHAEFVKRTMATDALISARAALHHHYVEWDGEPEDAVPLQEARSECDRVLAALQHETQP